MGWELYLPLIFCWALTLAAVAMFGFSLWSLRWPSVKGLVEVSFLDKESRWTTDSSANSIDVYQKNSETHQLAYSYEVHGVKYIGSNVKPWGSSDWTIRGGANDSPGSGKILWSGARDAAKWYRPGVIVDVYYCPSRPKWSCLEQGGFIIPILMGGASAFIYFGFVG